MSGGPSDWKTTKSRWGVAMAYLILVTAFFGALSYFVAAKRGVNKSFWLAMGIVFGPFALPFLLMAKRKP